MCCIKPEFDRSDMESMKDFAVFAFGHDLAESAYCISSGFANALGRGSLVVVLLFDYSDDSMDESKVYVEYFTFR
jgi:hypothetical protein